MFTLAISCLTTSNLPWFMDLTFQVPMPHCSLQHRTLLITHHIHNWELFLLWLHLFILSGVISPLISNSKLGTYQTWGVHLSGPYLFAFSYGSWGSQGKNTEVVCHSLLQRTTFCQSLTSYFLLPWPIHLGWPYMAWLIVSLSYMRLWSMRSNWLGFCDYAFQSVCPLMETDKRFMEAPWWERLTEGETGSCSDGWGHAQ